MDSKTGRRGRGESATSRSICQDMRVREALWAFCPWSADMTPNLTMTGPVDVSWYGQWKEANYGSCYLPP